MRGEELLVRAAEAASAQLGQQTQAYEVFVRLAETTRWERSVQGELQHQVGWQLGVACRCQRGSLVGFGAAGGNAQVAGRSAGRLALACLSRSHRPLPDPALLGAVPCPPGPELTAEHASQLFTQLAQERPWKTLSLTFAQAQSFLQRGEGFRASWSNRLLLLEWQQEVLPWLPVRFSRLLTPPLGRLRPAWTRLVPASEKAYPLPRGRRLTRALLAPDVVAPLLLSLVAHLPQKPTVASPAWELWDLRRHPRSLLPMACDGEGLPAADLPLVVHGQAQAAAHIGGACIRAPWDQPPHPAPLHLWQAGSSVPWEEALADLAEGFLALAPATEMSVEKGGRFRLLAVASPVHRGQLQGWDLAMISGSFKRLLRGLEAAVGEVEHVALGCVVSAPWLLVRSLEVSV